MRPTSLQRLVLAAAGLSIAAGLSACDDDNIAGIGSAEISALPSSLIFDQIELGTSQELELALRNVGTSDLVIDGYNWTGNASDFAVAGLDETVTVAPGQDHFITVTYLPEDEDIDAATLIVLSNARNEPELEIPVRSQGNAALIAANPNPVTIGAETVNDPVTVPVTIYNIGTLPFEIDGLRLVAATGDFALGNLPELPAEIGPNEEIVIDVTYLPRQGGNDSDQILVNCDAENCVGGNFFIDINGTAETPYLNIVPSDVGFGAVGEGETATAEVLAINEGQATLLIDSIVWAPNAADGDDEIVVQTIDGVAYDPAATWELAPGQSLPIVLGYTPADALPDTEYLVVTSNDPDLPIQQVRVAGALAAPRLEVFPSAVEFPLTARGFTATQTLIVRNTGTQPLRFSDPAIQTRDRGFTDGVFEVENLGAFPTELAAGEQEELTIRFAVPDTATEGENYYGLIIFETDNDPANPVVNVPVSGTAAGEPECRLRPVPGTVNFGTVPRGSRVEQPARVVNIGSGPCTIRSVTEQAGGFGFLFSDFFDLVSVSRTTPFDLGPGEEFSLVAEYFPRTITPLGETLGDTGSIVIDARDPYAVGDPTVTCGPAPLLFGATRACGLNLQARSGVASVAAIPGDVDFGLVTIGCNSQTTPVRIYNTGTADVQIESIVLEECTGEFSIAGVPRLPATLARGESVEVQLRYRPSGTGADNCRMVVTTNAEGGGRLVVPLQGEGVTFSRTVDRFEQVSGREVDLLFVIDNSGSMSEEQSNLASNFNALASAARTWGSDFQIGVITTQTESTIDNYAGERQPAELLGDPRIITPSTPGYESVFANNARVGDSDTTASSNERGLEAAQLALSDPLITDLGIACGADCVEPYLCVDPPALGSGCGGYNRGFLRETASLEIIFVSDEEDQSRAELNFYLDFFKSIKGFRNTSLLHLNAIVGPRGGCSGSGGTADAGNRYIELAEETGGVVASICDSNFSTTLSNIGNRAFGLRVEFFLSRPADPSTVRVYDLADCDGDVRTPRTTGFTFDPASNSVIFDEATAPQPGDCFEVEYEAACY